MDPTALGKLVAELLLAIQAISGYAVPPEPPQVAFLPHQVLVERACGRPCQIYGWFPPGDTVYLDDRLDPLSDPRARAILVHELVHFLQQEEGTYRVPAGCTAWLEREREAFDIQIRWVKHARAPLAALPRFRSLPLGRICREDGSPPG